MDAPAPTAASAARGREMHGIWLAVVAAAAFGTVSIFAKFGYDEGADPLALLGTRFVLTAACIGAFHVASGRSFRLPAGATLRLVVLGALGYGVEASLFFVALDHAPASVVMLIFYSYPIFTTVAAILFGLERARLSIVLALVMSSIGVASILAAPQGGLVGPLFALGASLAVTVYFLVAQILVRDVPPAAAAMWTSVGAAVSVSGAALVAEQSMPAAALPSAAALGVATAVAFISMYAAIDRIGSSRFSITATLELVTTVVLAAVLLGETMTVRVVLGTALIVGALPILAAARRTTEEAPPAPEAA